MATPSIGSSGPAGADPVVRLVAGVFWYGEARGAGTMARWFDEARAGSGPPGRRGGFWTAPLGLVGR